MYDQHIINLNNVETWQKYSTNWEGDSELDKFDNIVQKLIVQEWQTEIPSGSAEMAAIVAFVTALLFNIYSGLNIKIYQKTIFVCELEYKTHGRLMPSALMLIYFLLKSTDFFSFLTYTMISCLCARWVFQMYFLEITLRMIILNNTLTSRKKYEITYQKY